MVLVLPEAAEDEREPAALASRAKVGKMAPTKANKRQTTSAFASKSESERRKGESGQTTPQRTTRPLSRLKRREKSAIDAQPMNLDEQLKEKQSIERVPERDDQDKLK
ncbi:hypothetical protein DIPPA_03665 [Diplonema papillatum]|nr:hypothetical protein DIPPA_03665 [Diplonema papillatum]